MSSVIYAIVFKGEVLEGFETFSVKAQLAGMLKADQEKMATLFSGKQIVLKKTADKQQALKYGSALKKAGADIKIRVIKSSQEKQPESQSATPPQPATPAQTEGSGISLAPNVGNIVAAKPEAPPPDIDLSGMVMAEVGEGLLAEPKEEVTVDLDLDSISLAAAGEGVLVEPKEPAEEVEAPDFGLDEPGAVLETLHEEVELLNPDISSLAMAEAGADLLDPEDRDHGPEPEAPDTSNIHLVTNFDS